MPMSMTFERTFEEMEWTGAQEDAAFAVVNDDNTCDSRSRQEGTCRHAALAGNRDPSCTHHFVQLLPGISRASECTLGTCSCRRGVAFAPCLGGVEHASVVVAQRRLKAVSRWPVGKDVQRLGRF
jgi:hypothetical protein